MTYYRLTSDNIGKRPIFVKGEPLDLRQEIAGWARRAMGTGKIRTQQALARKAGINYETVNNLLNAKTDATAETLAKIAAACGVATPRIVLDEGGGGPTTALDWIGEAEGALRRVRRLLEPPPTGPGEDVALGIEAARAAEASEAARLRKKRGKGAA